jgi:hypothetical protein
MLEKIMFQLMNIFYTKGREAWEKCIGTLCPKIAKKVLKNADWSESPLGLSQHQQQCY